MSSKPDSQPAPITEIAMAGASVPPQQHDPSAWPPKQTMPGPGIGALPTGEIGYYMDIQEAKLRQLLGNTGVGVARTGDTITLSMPGRISFASNSARLEGAIEPLLAGISSVLVEFNKTRVSIHGHTDNVGAADHNQRLSERRGNSVARYLFKDGVASQRLVVIGYGDTLPVAPNNTDQGRARNRRIELVLEPIAL